MNCAQISFNRFWKIPWFHAVVKSVLPHFRCRLGVEDLPRKYSRFEQLEASPAIHLSLDRFSRLMWPSTGPLLHGWVIASLTAVISRCNVSVDLARNRNGEAAAVLIQHGAFWLFVIAAWLETAERVGVAHELSDKTARTPTDI
jgi:hypothetical protein